MSTVLPPFPENLRTQKLLTIDFGKLAAGDEAEEELLWTAATKFGFWYTKNLGMDELIEPMFEMGRETLSLSLDEKMKYWQGNKGDSFGYKAAGATFCDFQGNTDIAEFINVSKDDALNSSPMPDNNVPPPAAHRTYPEPVNRAMVTAVRPFTLRCVEVCNLMLRVFEKRLGLVQGELVERHRADRPSICESRCIRVPPVRASERKGAPALGPHTDFGSLTILFNKLGGLQVLEPHTRDDWRYVKPLPGHAICNIGDTLDILTGGILRSAYHRVLPPPGDQGKYERWSLAYFFRPSDDVQVAPLSKESALVAKAAKRPSYIQVKRGITASQWFKKRQSTWRTDSERGIQSYIATGGKYNGNKQQE